MEYRNLNEDVDNYPDQLDIECDKCGEFGENRHIKNGLCPRCREEEVKK